MKRNILTAFIMLLAAFPVYAGPFIDFENGLVVTGLNDARIPGNYGTRFSLPGTLGNEPSYYIRAKAGWTIKERHNIFILAAPLQIHYDGNSSRFLIFKQRIFFPIAPLHATFKFNSWRLTYRYDIVKNDKVQFGLGLTGKIRDAFIRLDSMGTQTTRPDLGFVPLINVRLQWQFHPLFSFLVDADWLVGPQGRAEDILAAFQYHMTDNVILKTGYRILEGGAKNSKVFTFSLFHYAVFGMTVMF
ncbi:MAG: hypothetical protein QUS13_07005 [Smithella sp.]|nr:hypothetical protein [Smithella sp.]